MTKVPVTAPDRARLAEIRVLLAPSTDSLSELPDSPLLYQAACELLDALDEARVAIRMLLADVAGSARLRHRGHEVLGEAWAEDCSICAGRAALRRIEGES